MVVLVRYATAVSDNFSLRTWLQLCPLFSLSAYVIARTFAQTLSLNCLLHPLLDFFVLLIGIYSIWWSFSASSQSTGIAVRPDFTNLARNFSCPRRWTKIVYIGQ
ncbi:hypothetical protein OH76DRAFT_1238950 [Lentinus brumalis]|uniref:Uncharacterized protein n=1 Tax=Lentinus brumalis TaxID=2498619 RepID=A0A371CS41_9APHY|nr:hypothetical protein OH76DRAFT_1238950 [Polyporus brumalis]